MLFRNEGKKIMSENVAGKAASGTPVKARRPKGMVLILIISIILIVGSIITLFGNYFSIAIASLMGAEFSGLFAVDVITSVVSVIVDIIGGVVGLIFCAKQSKASVIVISGAIMIIFAFYGILIDAVNDSSLASISVLLSVLLPSLYLMGGILNKRSAKA